MLDERELVTLLLKIDSTLPRAICEGDLSIRGASRRNRNFEVVRRTGTSYFVKQGIGLSGFRTVAREASFYERFASNGGPVASLLPRFCYYDQNSGVLVLELVGGARSMRADPARSRCSRAAAAAIGSALGKLHADTTYGSDGHKELSAPPIPGALALHRLWLDWLDDMSAANLELVKRIQQLADFEELLDELRQGWRVESLMHGDFKWDNCLVARSRRGRIAGVRIVDWENAGPGDPCWDIGSAMSDYLSSWLLSIPITGQDPPERFPALAREPLERMRPGLASLWQSYVVARRLDSSVVDEALIRAVRYSSARLLQTAFEWSQYAMSLSGNVLCILQVSLNILRRPQEAAVRLLGIPFRGRANQ